MNIVVYTELVPDMPIIQRIAPLSSDKIVKERSFPTFYANQINLLSKKEILDQIPSISNCDKSALEEALRIKDMINETSITVIALGYEKDEKALQECLSYECISLGVDKAILLKDNAFEGADIQLTAQIVSKAIEKVRYDLILSGMFGLEEIRGIEDDRIYFGKYLAAILGIPLIYYAKEIEISTSGRRYRALKEKKNITKTIDGNLPCIALIPSGVNTIRFATIGGIINAKKKLKAMNKTVETYNAMDIGLGKETRNRIARNKLRRERNLPDRCLSKLYGDYKNWPTSMRQNYTPLDAKAPLLPQIQAEGIELDQRLQQAYIQAYEGARLLEESLPRTEEEWIDSQQAPGAGYPWPGMHVKYEGIADHRILGYVIGKEPAIQDQLASMITNASTKNLFSMAIVKDAIPFSKLSPRKTDIKDDFSNDATTRVISRAIFRSRKRNDKTLRWQDILYSAIELSLAFGNYPDYRPIFVDWLIKNITKGEARDDDSLSKCPQVKKLLLDLVNNIPNSEGDFQYLITLEGNKPVFRVCSLLNDYVQRTDSGILVPVRGLLLHYDDNYWGFTEDEIAELNELLQNKLAKEEEFQKFFERNPHFFRKFDCREVYPLVHLVNESNKELVPDFIITNRDSQKAMVVELKLPISRLVIHEDNRLRFSNAVMRARAQLLTYKDWFLNRSNRELLKHKVGMEIYQPRLGVIIGRSSEFQSEYERQKLSDRNRDIDVVTYDDMLRYAERQKVTIRSIWSE